MKRNIELWIGVTAWERKADLGDDNFVLMNWSNGDLTEPAQINNSWSKQITLPGTPNNDAIFGSMWRHDRRTDLYLSVEGRTGIYFDPSVRTPFAIFESGAAIESGYIKLDEIVTTGATHSYKVTLYGGLGGFLYSLSYDAAGNRRTLADLIYKAKDGTVQDLGFTINNETVLEAWDFLANNTTPHYLKDNKWDFVNFAPAYNGFPTDAFSADKAIVDVQQTGLPFSVDGYLPPDNGRYVLVSFPSKKTEWEMRDLRSYLQRPVLRLGAVLAAIADPENNGGYTVDLDETIFDPVLASNSYVWKTWITLPLLTGIKAARAAGGKVTFSVSSGNNTIPTASGMAASYRIEIAPKIASSSSARYLHMTQMAYVINWIELRVVFRDRNNVQVRTETVRFGSVIDETYQVQARITNLGHFDASGKWTGSPAVFEWSNIEGIGNETYGRVDISFSNGSAVVRGYASGSLAGYAWTNPAEFSSMVAYSNSPQCSGSYNVDAVDSVRSNIEIKAGDLLKGDKTPADYLLSFCKMLGLRMIFDTVQKRITITGRNQYYKGRTTPLDISARINRDKPVTTVPLTFDKRWYAFRADYSRGEWAKYYANTHNRTFGEQRVDTGYGFNAGTNDVLSGVIFRGAVQVLERSKYFMKFDAGGTYPPGVFLDAGATYDLYNPSGESKTLPVPLPKTENGTPINTLHPLFDLFDKPQFHDAENAPYEERDTLIFFDGMVDVRGMGYGVSDDSQIQMRLNNNVPCWSLVGAGVASLPHFSRYCDKIADGEYNMSLDFGVPDEIPVPDIQFSDWAPIYARYWERFIHDRMDVDTRVVTCYVNLDGLAVGQDLLRQFYYFDGAIWSLNKIKNFSLTTWDDTECEFVRVQDPNNY